MPTGFEQSDEVLFRLLKNGDKVAFAEIYNRYWNKLYNVACNKLGNYFLAEDVVQELFLTLWNRRENIEIHETAKAYLAAALKYSIIKARLKMDKEKANNVEIASNISAPASASAHETLAFSELQKKLEKLVKELPEKSRLVYQLNKEEGIGIKEISEKLQLSQRTVESHLYRAVKSLRDKWTDNFQSSIALKQKIYNFYCSICTKKRDYIYSCFTYEKNE